jgi:hypothetical protein
MKSKGFPNSIRQLTSNSALVMDVVVSGAVDKFFRSTVILGNEEFDDCILYP